MNHLIKCSSGSYRDRKTIVSFERAVKNTSSNYQGSITCIEKGKCLL